MSLMDDVEIDRAAKDKRSAMRAMWSYRGLASDLGRSLGRVLVQAAGVSSVDRVLDVAAGTGDVAIPAALTGATVVASDLTSEPLDPGLALAAALGATIEWRQADAAALPFEDGEFDRVLSCVGVMFAPHHQASADEMVRVCRPGGTIGLISWTPEGFIGELFATMKPYAPPPPPGAQLPTVWGSESHVAALFGDRVTDVSARRQMVRIDDFGKPAEFRDYFKESHGPTIEVYKAIAGDAEKVAALDVALADLAGRYDLGDGAMEWEYLLLTARRIK